MLLALFCSALGLTSAKVSDAALSALAAGAKIAAGPVKRRATRWQHTQFGAPRPRDTVLDRTVWVAFHAAIAERLESAAAEVSEAIREASADRNPAPLFPLQRLSTMLEAGRRESDRLALEASMRLDDVTAEAVDWAADGLSELADLIVWPPLDGELHNTLNEITEQKLRKLAGRRALSLSAVPKTDQPFFAGLFARHDGHADWVATYARQFAHLARTRDVVWRQLIAGRLDALVYELRSTIADLAQEERHAITVAVHRYGLVEPTQWLRRIEALRRELRGEGERPEMRVFSGRAEEFAALDAWFDGSDADRHLIIGRSGIGKSVLVQHWIDGRARDATIEIVHIPLNGSPPHHTADGYRALLYLCARLGAKVEPNGLPLRTSNLDDLGDTLETLLNSIPDGRILIAIDGLDELDDPAAFMRCLPGRLPVGVKILLSARTIAGLEGSSWWISHLGLSDLPNQVTHLEPLDRRGLRQALAEAGYAPDRLSFGTFVENIFSLTDGGDPLLFAFLRSDEGRFRELVAEPYDAPDPDDWRSGYRCLLVRWINEAAKSMQTSGVGHDQRQICFAALVLIAFAPAPVGDNELLQLLRRSLDPRLLTLKGVLDPLRRWLIGDGRSGYWFSHPRLAEVVITDNVLMDPDTLRRMALTLGEWFADEIAAVIGGATFMSPYAATHAFGYLLHNPPVDVDPVTLYVTGPMLAAQRRFGSLVHAMDSVRLYIAFDAWNDADGSAVSNRAFVTRMLRLGLFIGSAPKPLFMRGAGVVLARAVRIGTVSSAEALMWALEGDDQQLWDHAYPADMDGTQVHLKPEDYFLPSLYSSLETTERNTVLRIARRRLDRWTLGENSPFPDECWAWLGTLLLRIAADCESQCDAAESLLASLPSWRAARCMVHVTTLLPQTPEWLAPMAARVQTATSEHPKNGLQNFDEELAWLQLAGHDLAQHATRLLPLLSNWFTLTAWPSRTGQVHRPDSERLHRLAMLAVHSTEARSQALQLLREIAPFSSRESAEAVAWLGPDKSDVVDVINASSQQSGEAKLVNSFGPIVAGFYGGLVKISDSQWSDLIESNPEFAKDLEARDVRGLNKNRLDQLERSADTLEEPSRTRSLCALASESDTVVRRLILNWKCGHEWLYNDDILAQTLARASTVPRQRLLGALRDHATLIDDKLHARAFATIPPEDLGLLLELVNVLPDATLRAHLAMQIAASDPALESDARSALGDCCCTAALLVRAMWDGARWSRWPDDTPRLDSQELEMREFLIDWLPLVLEKGFHSDPVLRHLLPGTDWLRVLRLTASEVTSQILKQPFGPIAEYGDPADALLAAAIARSGDFADISIRAPSLCRSEWAGAIANGICLAAVPEAKAAIEALLAFSDGDSDQDADANSDPLGNWFGGWKHLVLGLLTEHPGELEWFVTLLGQHGNDLDDFDFLPALARPQRADAIEGLAAHGLTPGQICLMLLASNDPETRLLGHRRLSVILRGGDRLPLLNPRYEDDAPFTARVVLAGVLAECEEQATVRLALDAFQGEAIRCFGSTPVEISIDVCSMVAEWLRLVPAPSAAADETCWTIIEFLG